MKLRHGAGGPNGNVDCDRAANRCEIHCWFETGGRRDDKNGIEANVANSADGVTGASLGSEAAKGADGNCEINLRGEVPATDAVGVEVKPDPPAGVAGLAVDDRMGKLGSLTVAPA